MALGISAMVGVQGYARRGPVEQRSSLAIAPSSAVRLALPIGDAQEAGTLTDARDGNTYRTVRIGSQWWMAENLSVGVGSMDGLQFVTDRGVWSTLTTPGYSWINNDEATYRDPYGALYNWYAVDSGRLCPTGWHVPTDAEWKRAEVHLGMDLREADRSGLRGSTVGGTLKEAGTGFWNPPNLGATDDSGFAALPGGHRNWQTGDFIDLGLYGSFWSSTAADSRTAWRRTLYSGDTHVRRLTSHKRDGFSVRCLKD